MLRTLLLGLVLTIPAVFPDSTPTGFLMNKEKWKIEQRNVIWGDDSTQWTGWTDCRNRRIIIYRFQGRPDKALTILHEAEHAMTCDRGKVHNEKWNNVPGGIHMGIYWSSEQYQRFIVQNPALIRWIQESGVE